MISSLLGTLKNLAVREEKEASNGAYPDSDEEEQVKVKIPQVKTGITASEHNFPPPAAEAKTTANKDNEENGNGSEIEKLTGKAILTAFDKQSGNVVIDRQHKVNIYDLPKTNDRFHRGCSVQFEAVRARGELLWNIVSMKLLASASELKEKDKPRCLAVVASILTVSDDFLELEANQLNNKEVKKMLRIPNRPDPNLGFSWIPGDRIQFQLDNMGPGGDSPVEFSDLPEYLPTDKILSVEPRHRKTVVGKVMRRNEQSLIDDNIYYSDDVCKSVISVGYVVKCEAISSCLFIGPGDNDYVYWRAISVQKSNFLHYTGIDPNADLTGDGQIDDVGREAMNHHQELMQDKCGVKIFPKFLNFSTVLIGSTAVKSLKVVNNSQQAHVLRRYHFNQDQSVCQFDIRCSRQQPDGTMVLMPNDEVTFEVSCKPLMIGRTTEMCVFDFEGFVVARNFSVNGRAKEEDALKIDTARGRPNFKKQIGEQDISKIVLDRDRKRIRGSQIVRAPFFSQKRLALNKVPSELFQIMKTQDEKQLQALYPNALQMLTFDNYTQKFQVSLWFEEIENDLRRRQYDLHKVHLNRSNTNPVYYTFDAPGIQDFQPPVNIQDTIDAFDTDHDANAKFQGSILKIENTRVTCVFGEAFDKLYTGFALTIQFNLGRTNYKRCHHAVLTAYDYLGERFLFPEDNITVKSSRILVYEDNSYDEAEEETIAKFSAPAVKTSDPAGASAKQAPSSSSIFRKHQPTQMFHPNGAPSAPTAVENGSEIIGRRIPSIRSRFVSDTPSTPSCNSARLEWFNTNLNEEQKDAVRRILRGQARPLPYIIYGPPGTGKTVTLVEAIMQVNKLDRNSRILVCGPSNASADVIAEYLANSNQYKPGDFIRLNGFLRAGQTMMDVIAPFCVDGEDLNTVIKNRLIIATCMTAGQFFSLDMPDGHFTHVFIDEAGYCTEPEALVPSIMMALNKGGQLVLAGDPNQLGPVLMSDVSQNIGLNKSLLERLMTRKLYSRDLERFPRQKYNPLVLTKLVKNYRAHPTLLRLPSRLFYDDDLEPMASHEEAFALCEDSNMKNVLVSEGVPLIVHGVSGECARERDSPSWCNRAEAVQVTHYVTTLMGKCNLSYEEIGVITPYRKQVEKIRIALQINLCLPEEKLPKVASVEEFQGGERKVIIISTVRSGKEDRIESQLERLGFLYQPKRFNVAITRAKALLIVVGNPHVLAKNHFWLQLLRYSLDLNAYKGCNIPIHLDRNIRGLCSSKEEDKKKKDEIKEKEVETFEEALGDESIAEAVIADEFTDCINF